MLKSETSQTEKKILYDITYMWNLKNTTNKVQFSGAVQFGRSVVSDSLRPYELQHTRPPCPSPTPRVH